jgi:hypothetical protein
VLLGARVEEEEPDEVGDQAEGNEESESRFGDRDDRASADGRPCKYHLALDINPATGSVHLNAGARGSRTLQRRDRQGADEWLEHAADTVLDMPETWRSTSPSGRIALRGRRSRGLRSRARDTPQG